MGVEGKTLPVRSYVDLGIYWKKHFINNKNFNLKNNSTKRKRIYLQQN